MKTGVLSIAERPIAVIGTIGLALFLDVVLVAPASGGVGGDSAIEGHLYNLHDRVSEPPMLVHAPLPISVALDGMVRKREFDVSDAGTAKCKINHFGAVLGVDLLPWFTVQGLLGSSDFQSGAYGIGDIPSSMEWGVGFRARVLNWHFEPLLCNVSWMRVDASACYRNAGVTSGGDGVDWQEGYADLTVSLVTTPVQPADLPWKRSVAKVGGKGVYDLQGEPDDLPCRSISVFLGPAVSRIKGTVTTDDSDNSGFNERQTVGFTTGLVVVPHDNIALKFEAQSFDHVWSYSGTVAFHF